MFKIRTFWNKVRDDTNAIVNLDVPVNDPMLVKTSHSLKKLPRVTTNSGEHNKSLQ